MFCPHMCVSIGLRALDVVGQAVLEHVGQVDGVIGSPGVGEVREQC